MWRSARLAASAISGVGPRAAPQRQAPGQRPDTVQQRASIPVKTQNDELDILTKKKPYEGAAPFRGRSGTNLYYISVQPTAVLDKLKAAFDRIDFTVANVKKPLASAVEL